MKHNPFKVSSTVSKSHLFTKATNDSM